MKNTIKDNLVHLKQKNPQELDSVKQSLCLYLDSQKGNLFNGNLKMQEEFYLIVSTIIIKEFNLDPNDTWLFSQLIQAF